MVNTEQWGGGYVPAKENNGDGALTGLSNLAWSWWFETKSEVNIDMKLSTWSHGHMISEFEIFLNLNKFFAVICTYLYAMYVKIYN